LVKWNKTGYPGQTSNNRPTWDFNNPRLVIAELRMWQKQDNAIKL
jgi:hypothetical protein